MLPGTDRQYELSPHFDITVAPTSRLDRSVRREIIDLCNRAFAGEDFDEMFELVAYSLNPTHIMGRVDGVLVSHALWSTRLLWLEDGTPQKAAYIDAVATDPQWQCRGLGSAIVRRLADEISEYDIGCLSTSRVRFYAKRGWELWTGPKAVRTRSGIESTPDVTAMIFRTGHTPPLDRSSRLTIEWRRESSW